MRIDWTKIGARFTEGKRAAIKAAPIRLPVIESLPAQAQPVAITQSNPNAGVKQAFPQGRWTTQK